VEAEVEKQPKGLESAKVALASTQGKQFQEE